MHVIVIIVIVDLNTRVAGEETIIDCSAVGYLHVGKAASHKKNKTPFHGVMN